MNEPTTINRLGLSSEEVLNIVKEWYLNIPDNFMNEDTEEIDEYIDEILNN